MKRNEIIIHVISCELYQIILNLLYKNLITIKSNNMKETNMW